MFDYLYPWSSEEKVWKCRDFDFVKWPVKVFTLFPFQTIRLLMKDPWSILYIYIIYVNKRYVSMAMHWTLWMHVFVFFKMLQRAILGFHMQASKCCFRCPVMIVFPWHCFTVSSWWMMLFNMITIVQLLIMWRNVSPKIRLIKATSWSTDISISPCFLGFWVAFSMEKSLSFLVNTKSRLDFP